MLAFAFDSQVYINHKMINIPFTIENVGSYLGLFAAITAFIGGYLSTKSSVNQCTSILNYHKYMSAPELYKR